MDQLRQQVARAQRRLVIEQLLKRAVWCVFACLLAAVVAIAMPRLLVIENLPGSWDAAWLVGGCIVGLLVAAAWTFWRSRSALDAAIEVDQRFDLRERVASSLSLSGEDQQTEAGRALVSDALRAIRRIDVGERFRVRLDRRAWLPLVPAAIALLLVLFVDNRQAVSNIDPNSAANIRKQVKESAESLRKTISQRRKEAEKRGLKDAEGLFKQIEKGTRDLTEKKDIDRTKAAVKLNDLAKKLEKRRQELGGKEGLRKQLQNMKKLTAGPGSKAAQAMKQGDWKKAAEEIEKLQKQLVDGKLDEKAKQDLAKQISQMKEKLEAAAEARRQAMENLKQQIEQQRRDGNLAQAGELQQKLDQLQQQQPQMNQLMQMAQQMGQLQQGLEQGDNRQAAQAMAQMAQQLAGMQQELDELEMLDAAMNQLEMAKGAMACQQCNGQGCVACQGGFGQMGFDENFEGPPGMGMGAGRGIGPRPDERNDTNTRDTRVRQKPGRGSAVFGGLVEGPNIRGDVAEAIKEELASLAAEPENPLTNQRLPGNRREHAAQYFEDLRKEF